MFVPPRYTEAQAREAIAASNSWSEALRRLGMCATGGGHAILRRYAHEVWDIPTDHFDPYAAQRRGLARAPAPLDDLLVEYSTTSRRYLKRRLLREGFKQPVCELCGQDEMWRGRRMAMILDHINGIATDNRLENLRMVCPNCNATLPTHCGRKNAVRTPRTCERCGVEFLPKSKRQRFCSRECGTRWDRKGRSLPGARRAERPPYEQLLAEIAELGYLGVGRKYGVSDNAIRKWRIAYEDAERRRGTEPATAPVEPGECATASRSAP